MEEAIIDPGQTVYSTGDRGDYLYVVRGGYTAVAVAFRASPIS
jgi:hypothetical protein